MAQVFLTPEVLYEDNYLLALNKPAGIASEHEPTFKYTVESLAYAYLCSTTEHPSKCYIGLPHRLDRPVSGVVLLAKKRSVLKMLMETFAKREIEKTYLAITEVKPPKEEDELENWLVKDNTFRKAMLYNSEVKYSSKVILRYKVLSEVSSRCLLQVNLVTGKYHQIRAQLSHIGCPIIGDARYGAKTVYKENAICLHANSLRLMHPVTNEPLHITCPPPDDEFWNPFREVWK